MSPETRIHYHPKGDKTEKLICNWCGLVHAVEPAYKKEVLERGQREIEENNEAIEELAGRGIEMTPEKTWTCGLCFLYLSLPPEARFLMDLVNTDCEDHPVPETRQDGNA